MNLFNFELPSLDDEKFDTILKHKNIEIKRIVSNTLKTSQTFIQDEDEWVIVLKGCAKIEMNKKIYKLKAGDYLFIPAKTTHTLLKTKKVVVWLAIHIY